MNAVEGFLKHAIECEMLAKTATGENRESLLSVAAQWRKLADDAGTAPAQDARFRNDKSPNGHL
jgi:hypothetical protein